MINRPAPLGVPVKFVQYYLDCLSQASYLIGDETTGRAAVVDPRRDVQDYLDDAAASGLSIDYVIETHVHADFLSGHLELAAATGATIVYGEAADVHFPHRKVGRRRAHPARPGRPGVPGHPRAHARVGLHRGVGVTRRGRAVRRADRRHPVHRGRRPSGPAGRAGTEPGVHGPPAVPVAAHQPAHPARRHPGVPAHGAGSACGKNLSPRRRRPSASSAAATTRCGWARPRTSWPRSPRDSRLSPATSPG
jgi:Zn-dependent hydrolases, including glyoxylases